MNLQKHEFVKHFTYLSVRACVRARVRVSCRHLNNYVLSPGVFFYWKLGTPPLLKVWMRSCEYAM